MAATRPHVPLIREATSGQASNVQDLLADGADPDATDGSGRTALHAAAHGGHDATVSVLLVDGAEKDSLDDKGESPLICAARGGHLGVVETLLGAGADYNIRRNGGQTALHLSSIKHATVVSTLLRAGAGKDALDNNGESPLIWAARGDHFVVTILSGPGAGKSSRQSSSMWAADRDNSAVVDTLLGAGADITVRGIDGGQTALHVAAGSGIAAKVSALLNAGAGKDALDNNGESPLLCAARKGYSAVVETLLAAGADSNVRSNADGMTPLLAAASIVSGESPFAQQLQHGTESTLALLLQHGAAVNAQDDDGATALHLACDEMVEGSEAVVSLLLRWGADETALNYFQQTAADVLDMAQSEDEHQEDFYCSRQEIEHVRALLARAPEDRAWRRRCWLVMIRSRVWRTELGGRGDGVGGSGHPNAADGEMCKVQRTEDTRGREHGPPTDDSLGGSGAEVAGGGWRGVVEELVGLELEGLFRTIVGFL